jgi:hypothetical protein
MKHRGRTLLVEAGIARIVGVPLMFAGILLGVAAIATPEFLAGDRDTRDEPQAGSAPVEPG